MTGRYWSPWYDDFKAHTSVYIALTFWKIAVCHCGWYSFSMVLQCRNPRCSVRTHGTIYVPSVSKGKRVYRASCLYITNNFIAVSFGRHYDRTSHLRPGQAICGYGRLVSPHWMDLTTSDIPTVFFYKRIFGSSSLFNTMSNIMIGIIVAWMIAAFFVSVINSCITSYILIRVTDSPVFNP